MPSVLITGGHTGIGFRCASRLASEYKCNLILAGRSLQRMEPAAQKLREYGVAVATIVLDTSSMASVRAGVTAIREEIGSGRTGDLQAIICNAGAQFSGPVSYSVDGFEKTFATNYLGHFLLIELLLDQLAQNGRIILVASGTHDPETVDGRMVGKAAEPDPFALASDGKAGKTLSGGQHYSSSKLCMVMMAYELDRRLRRSGSALSSIAFDPGAIPETGLTRTLPAPVQALMRTAVMKWLLKRIGITAGSLAFSGDSLADVAMAMDYANSSGKYLQSNDGTLIETRSSRLSYDEQWAEKLWDGSKQLVKLQPEEEAAVLG